jgi:hypothetical protein
MRPQFAMAAIFCLAVGSSILLLRARSDAVPGPLSVREAGAPAPDAPSPRPGAAAADQAPAKPAQRTMRPEEAPAAAAEPKAAPAATAAAASAAPSPAAPPPPTASGLADGPSTDAGRRALDHALAELHRGGCEIAAPDLRAVAGNYPETLEGKQAARELESCARVGAPAKAKDGPPPAGAGAPSSVPR